MKDSWLLLNLAVLSSSVMVSYKDKIYKKGWNIYVVIGTTLLFGSALFFEVFPKLLEVAILL